MLPPPPPGLLLVTVSSVTVLLLLLSSCSSFSLSAPMLSARALSAAPRPLLRLSSTRLSSTRLSSTRLSSSYAPGGTSATSLPPLESAHPRNNIGPSIVSKVGRNLHLKANHPLNTIKSIINDHLNAGADKFDLHDSFAPVVPVENCFDDLLIPEDHVSRSPSDTYYVDGEHCLRTHTSAHQSTLIRSGADRFLVTGDVYRRDEIDSTHYPVFHQMEGVKMFPVGTPREEILADLKKTLEGVSDALFGDCEKRWNDDYFPFTDPSLELEIMYQGEWMEVLGCGVIQPDIVKNAGRGEQPGWAFGLGLERLAMVLFEIPDIRLFWSEDSRFHDQFNAKPGEVVKFESYSKYPACWKDVSFWIPEDKSVHPNDIAEIVRGLSTEDLVEKVELIDEFENKKTGQTSNCFRLTYRSMDRSLTNEEIDKLQFQFRDELVEAFGVTLR